MKSPIELIARIRAKEAETMRTFFDCPECGKAKLELDERAETDVATYRPHRRGLPTLEILRRTAIVALCPACEFAIEVRP